MKYEAGMEVLEHSRETCIAPQSKEKRRELGNKQILLNSAPTEKPNNPTNQFIIVKVELARITFFLTAPRV